MLGDLQRPFLHSCTTKGLVMYRIMALVEPVKPTLDSSWQQSQERCRRQQRLTSASCAMMQHVNRIAPEYKSQWSTSWHIGHTSTTLVVIKAVVNAHHRHGGQHCAWPQVPVTRAEARTLMRTA